MKKCQVLDGAVHGATVPDSTRFLQNESHSLTAQVARMKPLVVSVLFAATCLISGCSSSPLTGAPQAGGSIANAPGSAGAPAAGGATAGDPAAGAPSVAEPSAGVPTSTWAPYPAGPYGTGPGATIENLSFLGWKHPDAVQYDPSKFETVRLSDFYDPDGHSDVKLLAINASAVWCSVCRAEYQDMKTNRVYANFRPRGVEILGTLFEDNAYYPAQPQDLRNWGSVANQTVTFPLVLDPGFKMGAYFDSDATPLNMLIDVRTMTIVSVTMGYSTTYWSEVQSKLDRL